MIYKIRSLFSAFVNRRQKGYSSIIAKTLKDSKVRILFPNKGSAELFEKKHDVKGRTIIEEELYQLDGTEYIVIPDNYYLIDLAEELKIETEKAQDILQAYMQYRRDVQDAEERLKQKLKEI